MPKAANAQGNKSVEDTYQKMSQLEHILELPDTYIGSVEKTSVDVWFYNEKNKKIEQGEITIVPGFFKIFDEILVNSIDHFQRLKSQKSKNPVTYIKVNIDPKEGFISVQNNGEGIPVVFHKKHEMYVPELIFGNLLTSSNYDKSEEKKWGGKNGYGAKLTNAFSTRFEIETIDSNTQQKYRQCFTENMSTTDKPKITSNKGKSYTKITYYPDFSKFGMKKGIDKDIYSFLARRVFDAAACTDSSVSVYLNEEKIETKDFKKYVNLYIGDEHERPRVYEKLNDDWEIVATISSDNKFEHVSFVNGINTFKGGRHVDHIADKIKDKVMKQLSKKNSGIKPAHIKDNLFIFVKCLLINPAFSSQSKEELTTAVRNFGSQIEISDNFIKKLLKIGLQDEVLKLTQFKVDKDLQKIGGKKERRVRGITKLEDANWAGSEKAKLCTLIITEGDSAMTSVVSGVSHVDPERNRYGIFPIRGKLLNVREAANKQIAENQEINNMMRILGLQIGKKYTDTKELRYSHLMVMTDSDVDGSHIKGLVFNFIHHFWPDLMKIDGFLQSFVTPIVKASKGKYQHSFYSQSEFEKWKNSHQMNGWNIKYYKGLGTSSAKEFKDYFEEIDNNIVNYIWRDLKFNMREVGNIKHRRKVLSEKFGITFNTEDFEDENDFKLASALEKALLTNDLTEASDENQIVKMRTKSSSSNSFSSKSNKNNVNDEDDESDTVSSSSESQSKFSNLQDVSGNVCDIYLRMAFDKKCADYRKKWLQGYQRNRIIDHNVKSVAFDDFIDNDLIHFSDDDNNRSIASVCDGLKPSQRKVLFASFKRRLKKEIKVAQLAGYVAEHSAYHHGETSLAGAIVGMAQNFVGSNNINYLRPVGQFGTRIHGGKDSASPRYIFTHLEPISDVTFHRDDEMLWKYLDDDGTSIEPNFYIPVIPNILVNGCNGIGTGYSCNVPQYNPREIISNLRLMMDKKPIKTMLPWYRGFKGTIKSDLNSDNKFICRGIYKVISLDTIEITELPVGTWTHDYNNFLESITIGNYIEKNEVKKQPTAKGGRAAKTAKPKPKREKAKIIKDFTKSNSDVSVYYKIKFGPGILEKLLEDKDKFEKQMKLAVSISTNNMWLYNYQGRLQRFTSPENIMSYFFLVRTEYYKRRREALLKYFKYEMDFISAKLRFVIGVINKEIHVMNKKKVVIAEQLEKMNFPKFPKSFSRLSFFKTGVEEDTTNNGSGSDNPFDDDNDGQNHENYDYLLSMPIYNLTYEKKKRLEDEHNKKDMEYKNLKKKTKFDLWRDDLNEIEKEYELMDKIYQEGMEYSEKHKSKTSKNTKRSKY